MSSWTERHLVNRAMRLAARLGRDIDGIRELEVRGRDTGKLRRTPVKALEVDAERYLVSVYGSSGWVRNLRAGKTARRRIGRDTERVVATERPDDQKLPVVRAYLATAGRDETRRRLAWAVEGVLEDEVRLGSMNVPVFRLSRRSPPR